MVCNVSGLFLWVDFFARRCKFLYRVVLIRRNGEEKKKGEKEIKRERERKGRWFTSRPRMFMQNTQFLRNDGK